MKILKFRIDRLIVILSIASLSIQARGCKISPSGCKAAAREILGSGSSAKGAGTSSVKAVNDIIPGISRMSETKRFREICKLSAADLAQFMELGQSQFLDNAMQEAISNYKSISNNIEVSLPRSLFKKFDNKLAKMSWLEFQSAKNFSDILFPQTLKKLHKDNKQNISELFGLYYGFKITKKEASFLTKRLTEIAKRSQNPIPVIVKPTPTRIAKINFIQSNNLDSKNRHKFIKSTNLEDDKIEYYAVTSDVARIKNLRKDLRSSRSPIVFESHKIPIELDRRLGTRKPVLKYYFDLRILSSKGFESKVKLDFIFAYDPKMEKQLIKRTKRLVRNCKIATNKEELWAFLDDFKSQGKTPVLIYNNKFNDMIFNTPVGNYRHSIAITCKSTKTTGTISKTPLHTQDYIYSGALLSALSKTKKGLDFVENTLDDLLRDYEKRLRREDLKWNAIFVTGATGVAAGGYLAIKTDQNQK